MKDNIFDILMEKSPVTDEYGVRRWYNDKGELHREGDRFAIRYLDSSGEWYLNGIQYLPKRK